MRAGSRGKQFAPQETCLPHPPRRIRISYGLRHGGGLHLPDPSLPRSQETASNKAQKGQGGYQQLSTLGIPWCWGRIGFNPRSADAWAVADASCSVQSTRLRLIKCANVIKYVTTRGRFCWVGSRRKARRTERFLGYLGNVLVCESRLVGVALAD